MSLATELSRILNEHKALKLNGDFANYACVAVILRGDNIQNLEVAYIRRATHEGDSWSGQVAFPGGKAEPNDANNLATATRETLEEIGFELNTSECIGNLDDIQARKSGKLLDFFIRPFVFYVDRPVSLTLAADEVADFFWIHIQDLIHPDNEIQFEVACENFNAQMPAIRTLTEPPLWGLTYLMTQNLLSVLSGPKK